MGTEIKYRSLYGDSDVGPVCGLLQIDGTSILLDCGWDTKYDTELLKPLEEVILFPIASERECWIGALLNT